MDAPASVEAVAPGQWRVTVERRGAGRAATGAVLLRLESAPDPQAPPHGKLAAARAWLSLGEQALGAGDTAEAISGAQAGLDELGRDYAPPGTKDDTGLKLLAAKDLAAQGCDEDAAATMLHMLGERTALYAERHRATVLD